MEKLERIIQDFCSGRLYPMKDIYNACKDIDREIKSLYLDISMNLSEDLVLKFKLYGEKYKKYTDTVCEESFKQGFSLAMRLMSAVYAENE